MTPGVWVSTTCWTNLMQQMRRPGAAVSILRSMLDFISVIILQYINSALFEVERLQGMALART